MQHQSVSISVGGGNISSVEYEQKVLDLTQKMTKLQNLLDRFLVVTNPVKISFCRVDKSDVKLPTRATRNSAAIDFYAPYDVKLAPGEQILVQSGLKVKISPTNHCLYLRPRSGLVVKFKTKSEAGLIDSDYDKPIGIVMHNYGMADVIIPKGTGICQALILVVPPVEIDEIDEATYVKQFEKTDRVGGFGSTTKQDEKQEKIDIKQDK